MNVLRLSASPHNRPSAGPLRWPLTVRQIQTFTSPWKEREKERERVRAGLGGCESFSGLCARAPGDFRVQKGRVEGERAPGRAGASLVAPVFDSKQTEARATPMGGEDGAEGRSSRARSPSSPAAPHLFCSRISSISTAASGAAPQGRIESGAERHKPLRGHPLTAVPNRRSQPTHRAPPCLSVARFSQLRHREAALNLPAKINSPRLFMPLPPRALGTAHSPGPGLGLCSFVSSGALRGHFYAPGMATFGDSGMSPAPLRPR
ncbi:hypothetical protein INR49_022030 [Caranx melampygus]|nr:hypothetical protein INR49_022030 [Caranx melampygus]